MNPENFKLILRLYRMAGEQAARGLAMIAAYPCCNGIMLLLTN